MWPIISSNLPMERKPSQNSENCDLVELLADKNTDVPCGCDVPWFHRERSWELCIWNPSRPHPTCLFIRLFLRWILGNHKYNALLSSLSYSSKLLKLRGSWNLPNLPLVWGLGNHMNFRLAPEVRQPYKALSP